MGREVITAPHHREDEEHGGDYLSPTLGPAHGHKPKPRAFFPWDREQNNTMPQHTHLDADPGDGQVTRKVHTSLMNKIPFNGHVAAAQILPPVPLFNEPSRARQTPAGMQVSQAHQVQFIPCNHAVAQPATHVCTRTRTHTRVNKPHVCLRSTTRSPRCPWTWT